MPGNLAAAVSIIMPTYNREAFIVETVRSIQDQAVQNWELIIVDDGSEDNTEQIIAGFYDQRIRYYKLNRTGSISKARKTGIERASGIYIAFIDSDDLWEPSKLEEQLFALQNNNQAGFCVTGGYNFTERGKALDYFYSQRDGMKTGNLFESFFRSELAVYIQSLMVRKSCFEKISFSDTDNDIDFILKLAKNFTGMILYKPLLFRRIHDGNYSGVNWENNYAKGIAAIRLYENELPPALVKDFLYRLYVNFGEDCITHAKKRRAIVYFLNAWKSKPGNLIPLKKIVKALLS